MTENALSACTEFHPCRVIKLGGSLFDLPDLPGRLTRLVKQWPPLSNLIVVGGGKACDIIREWDRRWHLGNERAHRMAIFAMTWNARMFCRANPLLVPVRNLAQARNLSTGQLGVMLAEPFLNDVRYRLSGMTGSEFPLPETWDLTSDSIAAYVARSMAADQLVMLKSVDNPNRNRCRPSGFGKFSNDSLPRPCKTPENQTSMVLEGDRTRESRQAPRMGTQMETENHLVRVANQEELISLAEAGYVDKLFPTFAKPLNHILWCNLRSTEKPA